MIANQNIRQINHVSRPCVLPMVYVGGYQKRYGANLRGEFKDLPYCFKPWVKLTIKNYEE